MKNKEEEITVCIPCFNSLPTIKIILGVLNFQDLYPKIIVLDNGSKDGTFEALCAMQHYRWFPDLKIEIRQFDQVSPQKHRNMDLVRHRLCELVKTEYLMFIDADVLIPPYCIKPMITLMEQRKDLAMLGLKYDVNTSHVKIGATILKTELIKNLKWRRTDTECQCLCVAKDLLIRRYKVEHYPETTARHLKAF